MSLAIRHPAVRLLLSVFFFLLSWWLTGDGLVALSLASLFALVQLPGLLPPVTAPTADSEPEASGPSLPAAPIDSGRLLQLERLAASGELSVGITHEINNPVAYIHSNLVVLREDSQQLSAYLNAVETALQALPSDHPVFQQVLQAYQKHDVAELQLSLAESLEDCVTGVGRLEQIIADMRRLARGQNSDRRLTAINEELQAVIRIARSRIKGQIQLEVHLLDDCPLIECNGSQIGQVVLNLLVNAIQALGEARGVIRIDQRLHGRELETIISDDGPGMDESTLERAFEMFFSTKSEQEGTGMGLPLSRELVQQNGGRLILTSAPGCGTRATVLLPLPRS